MNVVRVTGLAALFACSAMLSVTIPAHAGSSRLLASNATRIAAADRGNGRYDELIARYASENDVPVSLAHAVVSVESNYNPKLRGSAGEIGLMQVKLSTARGMGYDGPPKGLFDAETNLKYAVKYLRGAWLVSGGNAKRADQLYQTGYYYDAKRKGLLEATGLGHDRGRRRVQPDA